jgi:putative tricarboxylic transport membrane protein
MVFGGIGYGMRVLRFPPAPLLIGLVLGPEMEAHLRRSLIVSHGDPLVFLQRPVSATILVIACLVLGWTIYGSIRAGRRSKQSAEAAALEERP